MKVCWSKLTGPTNAKTVDVNHVCQTCLGAHGLHNCDDYLQREQGISEVVRASGFIGLNNLESHILLNLSKSFADQFEVLV